MPRHMSFQMTTRQVRARTKDVTRRVGWLFLKAGMILNAIEQGQGLKKGEHFTHICQIRVKSVRREPLYEITQEEVIREGFPKMTTRDFINMFCEHNKVMPDEVITRIEFEYI